MAMAEIVLRIARIYIALSTSHAGASCTGPATIARVALKTCALLHEAQEAVAELLPRRRKASEQPAPILAERMAGHAVRAVSRVLGALGEWLNLPKL